MLHLTVVSLSSDSLIVYDKMNNDNDQNQP